MPNIIDYLLWRGDLPFSASPFSPPDNLILSLLSLVDYSDVISSSPLDMPVKLSDFYKDYTERYPSGQKFGYIIPDVTHDMIRLTAQSVRFRDVYISAFRNSVDSESQFAAVTFVLPDDSVFVSFRGTDDTLVGWKEDFAMSYRSPIKAQILAAEYLAEISEFFSGPIRCGGHSKGGNLAIYALVYAPDIVSGLEKRIIAAYSNDGPGFTEDVIEDGKFKRAAAKMRVIVPQSSVIGLLLGHREGFTVVESNVKSGIMQHDPFTWQVMGRDFVRRKSLSPRGKKHERVLSDWLSKTPREKRREFTEILFSTLGSTGAKTLSDLSVDQFPKLISATKTISELDRGSKETVQEAIKILLDSIAKPMD